MLVATKISNQLAAIGKTCIAANGFASNVGASVRVAMVKGHSIDAPMLFITPGRESATARYGVQEVQRDWVFTGFVDTTSAGTEEHELVDQIIWDIRRCVESRDSTLEGLTERVAFSGADPGYHEDGSTIVGAAVTYQVTYSVDMADPSTAL